MTSLPARAPLLAALLLAAGCGGPGAPAPAPAPATAAAISPDARPRPYRIFEDSAFARAVRRGTRTRTGEPGPRYWTQGAEYRLRAAIDSASRRLTGEGTVRYHNRSPDTLRTVAVHLRHNLFAPGGVRNEFVPLTEGVRLTRVAADGARLQAVADSGATGYRVVGTVAWLRLPRPLAPGATASLDFAWSLTVPPDGAPRGGVDGDTWFVSYWYPQLAVYDDVSGWQVDQYMGQGEFHMGFADYDVELTVPAGWLVAATGTLENAAQVLSPRTRARLDSARAGDEVVRVVRDDERGPGRATLGGSRAGTLTWRFRARDMRDFAFGTSPEWLWDATRAVAADSAGRGDTVAINTFYRPSRRAWAWGESARYARHSIEFLSRQLWPYPYPHASAADGPASCTGMEFPMLTCIGGERDTLRLYSVMVHELAHVWFPMQVGSDEQRHAWMDEGLTRFNQAQAMREFFRGYDLETIAREQYIDDVVRTGIEAPLMTHADRYPSSIAYSRASYAKMATNMVALRSILGDSIFTGAYREYGRRWRGRHPTPYDFWNTFEHVSGRDLDWFWRTWWFETWTMDHAVAGVRALADGSTAIDIEDRGLAPMPARVAVLLADGTTRRLGISEDAWLGGARRHTLIVSGAAVARVTLDPERRFPDVDRANDVWEAP